jgi:cell division protein FtsN
MARDYKPKRAQPGRFSGWFGLGAGLGLGLAVAGVVYLKDHKLDAPAVSAGKPIKRRAHGNEAAEAGESAPDDSKTYAFYEMLPKFEVVVPEKDKDVRPDIKPLPETRSGTYVLQVGSYKNFADADRVRAKLALQGIESHAQKVTIENDTWYRIRIGPTSKLDELNRTRGILHKADVDALVIRVGD